MSDSESELYLKVVCNDKWIYCKEIEINSSSLGTSIVGKDDLYDLGFRKENLDKYGLTITIEDFE